MNIHDERRYLLDRADTYLFSYDLTLRMRLGGRRWNLSLRRPFDADKASYIYPVETSQDGYSVFHVRDENVVGERDALWGHVCWINESLSFPNIGDSAVTAGTMTIRSREGAYIDTVISGVYSLEELGHRRLGQQMLSDPVEMKAALSLRFDTAHAKYRWLTQTPCVGFGQAKIQGGKVVDGEGGFDVPIAVDVYTLC